MALPATVLLLVIVGLSASGTELRARLVNGPSSCSGRIEVLREGQWGTICDDDWDLNDTKVLCRQLGCGAPIGSYSSGVYGEGATDQPIWLTDVNCRGTESLLGHCRYNEEGEPHCKHDEDAGVKCEEPLQVRLTNGSTACNGRLEVFHAGQWGTVCDDSWDIKDARVVCRELGCASVQRTSNCGRFGEGTSRIWLDEVQCTGKESSLTQCAAMNRGEHDCSHQEDVGVVCRDPFKLRLSEGPHACAGRLEVFHEAQWGTVCNDHWQQKNTEVVCQELGCGSPEPLKKRQRRLASATGPIWLDDVVCSGEERTFQNCRHRVWGYHDCTHREDIYISCSVLSPPSVG
ncbi:CD5 antigen-like [Microcaecilia unicolor]|uniref:Soluble scavenger receptor cysteine-rich domain-containing protein SSC5D n=1 Tax=Microcaecilia unicolor TaxID=1415580 RepID=A0A6P7XT18_9AMPH|nr:CD5 antigen-like [Microcaecilia unicolor]